MRTKLNGHLEKGVYKSKMWKKIARKIAVLASTHYSREILKT